MAILSIFGGIYCHTEEIVTKLENKLNYRRVDEELLQQTSQKFGISVEKLQKALTDELPPFSKFSNTREKIAAKLKLTLAGILQQDNLLVTGYPTHLIPRTITHMLKVCIIANMDYRVKLAMDTNDLSEKNAHKAIRNDDKKRSSWTNFLLEKPPFDDSMYDMIIPTQDRTVDEAIELILEQLQSDAVKTTGLSQQAARDFLLSAKVNHELTEDGQEVDVYSEDGVVTVMLNKYVVRLEKKQEEIGRAHV